MGMTKERFAQTAFKMSYAEHRCCECGECTRADCKQRGAYRRVPKIDSGLALCPNLMFATVIGEEGVLVERNGKIKDYRSREHALAELKDEPDCGVIIKQLKMGKVYCSANEGE